MAITDVFKTKQFKSDIERLTSENQYLNSLLTPEMRTAVSIKAEIQKLTAEKDSIQADIEESKRKRQDLVQEIFSLDKEIEKKKEFVIFMDDEMLYQDFGLYTPVYNLMNSEMYKDKLAVVREQQKSLIKNDKAANFPTNFTYNNSLAQGKNLWRTM